MKIILFLLSLTFCIPTLSEPLVLPIIDVIDGDTIETQLNLSPPLNKVYVRVQGIDAPESNHMAKCDIERKVGESAKEYLKKLLKNQFTMTTTDYKWDKYGGRIVADVAVNGINIRELMIKSGYALPYEGRGHKPNWCLVLSR